MRSPRFIWPAARPPSMPSSSSFPFSKGPTRRVASADVVDGPADGLSRAVASREITGAPFEQWWAPCRGRMACLARARAWRRTARAMVPGGRAAPGVGRRPDRAPAAHHRYRVRRCRPLRARRRPASCRQRPKALSSRSTRRGISRARRADLAHVRRVCLIVGDTSEAQRAALDASVRRGRVLAECTNLARALGNEPSNVLTPRELARRAEAAAEGTTLSVTVLDETRDRARAAWACCSASRRAAPSRRA